MMFYVRETMPCLPPMTGNGKHTNYKHGDDRGMVYDIVIPKLKQISNTNVLMVYTGP
jgi:hypothetical protein